MARFNGGTLEELFDDDSTPQSRAAVRAEIEAASVAADGAALAFEAHADEMDVEAERDVCYSCQRLVSPETLGRFGVDSEGDDVAICLDCYAAEIAEGELAYDRERCIERGVPDPAPNVFRANWRELVEARADAEALALVAAEWDLMADRARATMLPTPETILARLLGRPNKRAAGKAAQAVVEGVQIRREGDALVIASQSDAGREWRVDANGCGCRAVGSCWHGEVFAVTVGWED